MRGVLAASLLIASSTALVVAPLRPYAVARAAPRAMDWDAMAAEALKESMGEKKVATAEECGLEQAEFDALKAASLSQDSPAKDRSGPEWALSPFGNPLSFFSLLRNTQIEPVPEVWVAVREQWPALKEKTDDELAAANTVIKAEYVDARSL